MKVFLYLLVWLVSGCGGGGGGSSAGSSTDNPPVFPPSCKALNDVWTSDVDGEQFDLTSLVSGYTNPDYSFTGYDNTLCSYASNPNHAITATLQTPGEIGAGSVPYHYRLRMNFTLEMGGSCARYKTGSNHNAYIYLTQCDQIEVCRSYDMSGLVDCKLFH